MDIWIYWINISGKFRYTGSFDELTSNKRFALEAEEIRNCPYIRVVQIEDDKSVDIIRRVTGLDLGESEAIILTDNLHSDSKEAECSIFLSD